MVEAGYMRWPLYPADERMPAGLAGSGPTLEWCPPPQGSPLPVSPAALHSVDIPRHSAALPSSALGPRSQVFPPLLPSADLAIAYAVAGTPSLLDAPRPGHDACTMGHMSPQRLDWPVPMPVVPSTCSPLPPASRWVIPLPSPSGPSLEDRHWASGASTSAVPTSCTYPPLVPQDALDAPPMPPVPLPDEPQPPINALSNDEVLQGFEKWMHETDHFSHVITMKGSVCFVSPNIRDILGYDPRELTRKSFAKFCHPADFQPVLRELKEARQAYDAHPDHPGDGISLLYRARRKDGSYVWIEATGSIMNEESRTRKVAILIGRPVRPPSLGWADVRRRGGLGDSEFWLKLSRQGLLLHVAEGQQGTRETLSFEPGEIVGSSMRQLTPPSDHVIVLAAIETAFQGTSVRVEHRLFDRTRNEVDVVTVFHPPSGPGERTIYCQINTAESDRRRRAMSRAYSISSQSSNASLTTAATSPASLLQLSLPDRWPSKSTPYHPSNTAGAAAGDVFEDLHGEEAPNFHLTSHRLTLQNRQLNKDLEAAERARSENRQRWSNEAFEQSPRFGSNLLGLSLGEVDADMVVPSLEPAEVTKMEDEMPRGTLRPRDWGLPSPATTPITCLPPSVIWS